MKIKGWLLTLLGASFLFVGILLLFAVLFTWLNPLPVPSNEAFQIGAQTSVAGIDLNAFPALSPYFPTPTAVSPPELSSTINPGSHQTNPDPDLSKENGVELSQQPSDTGNHIPITTAETESNVMRMIIPDIGVDAPVVSVGLEPIVENGRAGHQQWGVPDQYAAGWHNTSAPFGQPGNTVLNGHNNIHGAIFQNLVDLPLGAEIIIKTNDQDYYYKVTGRDFLLERGAPLRERLHNARYISSTDDERMTIVTCWPNSSNSHRLVVIAHPVDST